MSSIYNTEPLPTASVILHTTQGELSVELFAKQTPLTCRNFLQHCLDGYYDNTIFHRLVPGFILQGGDPTGTGNGGESIYDAGALSGDLDPWPMDQRRGRNAGPAGADFKDEFHSRLKFNRRGLLGMANGGTADSNGSQFFFTLGKTDELVGKNTMFGRIAGDTIYNLAKMGEADVEEGGERPLYPVKLTRVEILVNPFEDMRKQERVAVRVDKSHVSDKKPKKRKGGKQLLSFGDDEGDVEDLPVVKKPKYDTRLVVDVGEEEPAKMPKKSSKKTSAKAASGAGKEARDVKLPPARPRPAPNEPNTSEDSEEDSPPEPEADRRKALLEKTNAEIAALKASMKRSIHQQPVEEKTKSALEELVPETATRGRKKRSGGGTHPTREEQRSLDMLRAFQSTLNHVPGARTAAPPVEENGDEVEADKDDEEKVCDLHFIAGCQSCHAWDKQEGNEESGDEGWLSHTANFAEDKLGKDLSYRKKAEEELVVIDPREKARTLKEEKRSGRESRSGGGREWDQARNAQMSRAAALTGRGAK